MLLILQSLSFFCIILIIIISIWGKKKKNSFENLIAVCKINGNFFLNRISRSAFAHVLHNAIGKSGISDWLEIAWTAFTARDFQITCRGFRGIAHYGDHNSILLRPIDIISLKKKNFKDSIITKLVIHLDEVMLHFIHHDRNKNIKILFWNSKKPNIIYLLDMMIP